MYGSLVLITKSCCDMRDISTHRKVHHDDNSITAKYTLLTYVTGNWNPYPAANFRVAWILPSPPCSNCSKLRRSVLSYAMSSVWLTEILETFPRAFWFEKSRMKEIGGNYTKHLCRVSSNWSLKTRFLKVIKYRNIKYNEIFNLFLIIKSVKHTV